MSHSLILSHSLSITSVSSWPHLIHANALILYSIHPSLTLTHSLTLSFVFLGLTSLILTPSHSSFANLYSLSHSYSHFFLLGLASLMPTPSLPHSIHPSRLTPKPTHSLPSHVSLSPASPHSCLRPHTSPAAPTLPVHNIRDKASCC